MANTYTILKTRFKSQNAFLDAIEQPSSNSNMFCPTTTELGKGETVLVEIAFPHLPNKTMVRGSVSNWRPALPRLRVRAGANIVFAEDEHQKLDFLRRFAKGEVKGAIKRKHPRVPIEVDVRWKPLLASNMIDARVKDISIGGAQLLTTNPLTLNDDVVLELIAPGGVKPISIAGKVSNIVPGGYGIRFVYRDGGGSRRLKEVVRRLTTQ